MKKIVFVLNSLYFPRCIKRVEEFMQQGFEVEVYGFTRMGRTKPVELSFPYTVLGDVEEKAYRKRMPLLVNTFRRLGDKYKGEDVVFYLFKIDSVLAYKWSGIKKPYIYEESDLTHTYFRSSLLKNVLELMDRRVIRKSLATVLTSEGFVKYHFGNRHPKNVFVIPNRLKPSVMDLPKVEKQPCAGHLRIGFVGCPRFKSVLNFAQVFCDKFPDNELHIFGGPIPDEFARLEQKYTNYYLHGEFVSPDDLPDIYSQMDLVLSTYDTDFENVRYAEPNKLYEAMYFDTPIIVSSNTFLADKVGRLGIGWNLDPMSEKSIVTFFQNLTSEEIKSKTKVLQSIDKAEAVNNNRPFIEYLRNVLA